MVQAVFLLVQAEQHTVPEQLVIVRPFIMRRFDDKMIACSTLSAYCTSCSDSSTCLACSGGYLIQGSTCVSSCSTGYYNNGAGVCTCKKEMGEFKLM